MMTNLPQFPEGTKYQREIAHHPEQVAHRWITPEGVIYTGTEFTDPDEIESLRRRGLYAPEGVDIHKIETPETRAQYEARGWTTWKEYFEF